jgi:hypothetical protein
MAALRQFLCLSQLPSGKVAGAHVENLPFADQLFHRLPDFVPRRLAVHVMHLVQVDAVGLEAPETRFTGPFDVQCGQARMIRPVAHAPVDFRGEDDLASPAAALREPTADDLFRPSLAELPSIHVRRIEKIQPGVERPVHDRETVGLVGLRTEIHRAQAQAADLDPRSTELHILHRGPPVRRRWFQYVPVPRA